MYLLSDVIATLTSQLNDAQRGCRSALSDADDVNAVIQEAIVQWAQRPLWARSVTVRRVSRRVANRGARAGMMCTVISATLRADSTWEVHASRQRAPSGPHGRGPTWWITLQAGEEGLPPASERKGWRRSSDTSATKTL